MNRPAAGSNKSLVLLFIAIAASEIDFARPTLQAANQNTNHLHANLAAPLKHSLRKSWQPTNFHVPNRVGLLHGSNHQQYDIALRKDHRN